MKKATITIIVLLCFVFVNRSYAQENSYGIRIGLNISSISSDDITEDFDAGRLGMVVGFLAEYPLSEKISIQPEFQYSSVGNEDDALQVDYLQLPVFLKLNITEMFNVHLGPQVGLKIWEWEDNAGIDADFETFNFEGVGGIGVNITENFFADLRYGFGFYDIIETDMLEGTTSNIQLSVGYRL